MSSSARLRAWFDLGDDEGFPLEGLPYGVFRAPGRSRSRVGVALGPYALDLDVLAQRGLFADLLGDPAFFAGNLDRFVRAGAARWIAVRARLQALLREGGEPAMRDDPEVLERALVRRSEVELVLPVSIGDYVDFYASLEHATTVGKIFRPGDEPLAPNWRWMPVGYHGRAGTIVVGGSTVRRPCGQRLEPGASEPAFGPSRRLDVELELAALVGDGPPLGTPIPLARAREHIFGVALFADWSARDLQTWEARPLGPFLSKSFASSLGPWVLPLEALEPYRVAGPPQEPAPLAYLHEPEPRGYELRFELALASAAMRERGLRPQVLSRPRFAAMYWSLAQQLAHLTSNGANLRAGDLLASGTISSDGPLGAGSLLELSWGGRDRIALADGTTRAFLEDGDEIVLRGWAEHGDLPGLSLGELRGRIAAA
ncbi:MAG: fumarylacetoacetase [Vulcanimicrobiaceae bacterium]